MIVSACGSGTYSTANTTAYLGLSNTAARDGGGESPGFSTTESPTNLIMRTAGTIKNLWVRIWTNSMGAGTASTIRTRKNNSTDLNQFVSIGSGATGAFEDTTHTDTIAAGDLINLKFIPGVATGTVGCPAVSVLFAPTDTSKTVSKIATQRTATWAEMKVTFAEATRYAALQSYSNIATVETFQKTRQRKAGTFRNMAVNVTANARTTTTTFRLRKNGADGNCNVAVNAGVTGTIENTSSSDSIAVDDDVNWSITSGTGTEILTYTSIQAEFESTAGDSQVGCAYSGGTAFTEPITRYFGLSCDLDNTPTENDIKVEARAPFTFSNLGIMVSASNTNLASTCDLRVNNASSTLTIPIGLAATGLIQDTTHTVTVAATDEINYRLVVPSMSGTRVLTITWINMWANIPPPSGNNITRSMPTETTTISETSKTLLRNKIRTRSETITVSD